jgi:mRNA interferase MazF
MTSYKLGEIVLMRFPYTDNITTKKRPALIIKDTNDGDVIVCRITSKRYNTLYDIEIKESPENGLKLPSVIRIHKIAALEKDQIDTKLGEIENASKIKVLAALHQLLQS